MLKTMPFAALVLALGAATPALAEEDRGCATVPREQWLSADTIKAKGTALGYEVRRVKAKDGCYELYAIDRNGAKVELYLNPVTGEVVNRRAED